MRREVPVIVMCDYCTTKNLDHAAPESMQVAGAEGVVFIARGLMSDEEWTKVKLKLLKVLREFKANRAKGKALAFGGGGEDDEPDLRVHWSEVMLFIDVKDAAEAAELKTMLDAQMGSDGDVDVAKANDGVDFKYVDDVENFVAAPAALTPDDTLSGLATNVAHDMSNSTTDLDEAKKFAKQEMTTLITKLAGQVQSDVNDANRAIRTGNMFAEVAKQFGNSVDDVANIAAEALKEATQVFTDGNAILTETLSEIENATTSEQAVGVLLKSQQGVQKMQAEDSSLPGLLIKITDGIRTADSMCPQCGTVDPGAQTHEAKHSGVRTEEADQDKWGDHCSLIQHPLIDPIEQATKRANNAKIAWVPAAAVAAFVHGSSTIRPGAMRTALLQHLVQNVVVAQETTDSAADDVRMHIAQVTDILSKNKIVRITDKKLALHVNTEEVTGCSDRRVSAVKRANGEVCLVVMDGDETGDPANLTEVWAAAHEAQASLARYRTAHALFRAAQLRGDKDDADEIRRKIIELQVDEVVDNIVEVRKQIVTAAVNSPTAGKTSIAWIETQGYNRCLELLNYVITETGNAARQALTEHTIAIAELHARANDDFREFAYTNWQTPGCHAIPSTEESAEQSELGTALARLELMPDVGDVERYELVLTSHKRLKDTITSVKNAHEVAAAHVEWARKTFCTSGKPEYHDLVLPFLAQAAKESLQAISQTVQSALSAYKTADSAFAEQTKRDVLCKCDTPAKCTAVVNHLVSGPTSFQVTYVVIDDNYGKPFATLLLSYERDADAERARTEIPADDPAVYPFLRKLIEQYSEDDASVEPQLTFLAAVLQPGSHKKEASLEAYLDPAKYGLNYSDGATSPPPPGSQVKLSDVVVNLFVKKLGENFEEYVSDRLHAWDTYVARTLKSAQLQTWLDKRRSGDAISGDTGDLVPSTCVSVLACVLEDAAKQTPILTKPDEFAIDVKNAVTNGAPLYALIRWIDICKIQQKEQMAAYIGQTSTQSWLPTRIVECLRSAVDCEDPNVNVVKFLKRAYNAAVSTDSCGTPSGDEAAVRTIVLAHIEQRKALAGNVNTMLGRASDALPNFEKEVWREFWIAPAEAVKEWSQAKSGKQPAPEPSFFKHVFPLKGTSKDKDKVQQEKYAELGKVLENAPPSIYMYAFLQARKWLKPQVAMGGGSRRPVGSGRREAPAHAAPSAPEPIAVRGGGPGGGQSAPQGSRPSGLEPSALPTVKEQSAQPLGAGARPASAVEEIARPKETGTEKSMEAGPTASGGGGGRGRKAAAASQLPGRQTLHPVPKGGLAGAVRRAVTLIVLEANRTLPAECCRRILAGEFAQQTRRADSAVIQSEPDRAALCRLAKDMCLAICR